MCVSEEIYTSVTINIFTFLFFFLICICLLLFTPYYFLLKEYIIYIGQVI